jgi:hypothetical protein
MNEDEIEQLRELADEVRRAWVAMPPNPRATVRVQSNDLYDALGALATFVSLRREA